MCYGFLSERNPHSMRHTKESLIGIDRLPVDPFCRFDPSLVLSVMSVSFVVSLSPPVGRACLCGAPVRVRKRTGRRRQASRPAHPRRARCPAYEGAWMPPYEGDRRHALFQISASPASAITHPSPWVGHLARHFPAMMSASVSCRIPNHVEDRPALTEVVRAKAGEPGSIRNPGFTD